MIRAAIALFTILLMAISLGQNVKTFTITLPEEGPFLYVIQKPGESKDPLPIETKSLEVAAPDDPNGYKLYVIDSAINRAASTDLIPVLKTGKFAPKPAEFSVIHEVTFKFTPKSGIVNAASLEILEPKPTVTHLITAEDNNLKVIRFIPSDKISYRVTYQGAEGQLSKTGTAGVGKSSDAATIEVELNADYPAPGLQATPGETVDDKDSAKSEAAKPTQGQHPIEALFRLLIGLAVVGGLGYAGWWYYKNNQTIVEQLASQAGLNPKASQDPTGALPPEPVKKDLQKIELGQGNPLSQDANLGQSHPLSVTMERGPGGEVAANPRLTTATGDVHLILEGASTIGREAADITISDQQGVSRLHAQITRSGTQITIQDSGSTNGTYINGTKIAAPTVLNPGDTIQFGAAVFRYES